MISEKLSILKKGIAEHGFWGYFRYFLFDIDNKYVGHFVELVGGRIKIEGLLIDTNSKSIPTRNKSQFLQNRFEKPERDNIKKYLDRSVPVIELGGSLGVVACMTNRLLDSPSKHIVVEAHPDMARLLRVNKTINDCQFEIIEKAIGYTDTVTFFEEGFSSRVEVDNYNGINITTTSLQAIIEQTGFENISLICDIEGSENDLLKHEPQVLQQYVSLVIIELHPTIVGEEIFRWSLRKFEELGFQKINEEKTVYVFRNKSL